MATSSYSFREVLVTYGAVKIQGFAEGDCVTIETPENITMSVGEDGRFVNNLRRQGPSTVGLRLMADSPSIAHLSAQANLQAKGLNRAGQPLKIVHIGTGETWVMAQGFVPKQADVTFSGEVGVREWQVVGKLEGQQAGKPI